MDVQPRQLMRQTLRQRHPEGKPPVLRLKYAIMETLSEKGPATQTELAEAFNEPVLSIRKVTQRLLVSGLVRLTADPGEDRIAITPSGMRVTVAARRERRKWLNRHYDEVAVEEMESLFRNRAK